MALKTYKQKRKFTKTPEPRAIKKRIPGRARNDKRALRFVVQKHAASRLHYDFRLELDGVLKSWAVPKGPSLNPEDKRLAMMVEDHPYDYRNFEGIIPAGNYGGGTVMVWDEGTYHSLETDNPEESRKNLKAGLAKGDLKLTLHGAKLNGSYALVKMKSRDKNAWLLIKKNDDYATKEDITKSDHSAVTGRTMDEIAEGVSAPADVWPARTERVRSGGHSDRNESEVDATSGKKTRMLREVKPMLATPVDEPFDRAGWLFEIKWDGYRAIAEVSKKDVKLYSRNQKSFTDRYQPVVKSLAQLGHEAVLDGEVVVLDDDGHSKFQLLQQYLKTGEGDLVYYVFDLLWLDGYDVRQLPLRQRKELLAELLPQSPNIRLSEHVEDKGTAFYKAAEAQGLEGIIAKDGDSPYHSGSRSSDWLKIKTVMRQEAVVGGFTQPKGSRKDFGALVLGVYEGDDLVYIGHTGGGFDDKTLRDMYQRLKPLVRKNSPFKETPKTNTPATWVKPELVVEVKFQEWTEGGHMRKPIFIGLREDKQAKEVRREKPAKAEQIVASSTAKEDKSLKIGGRKVKVTHLNKVYWPDDKYTKGDLVSYYQDVAKLILPYLKDRPENLNRHPNGITGESFYQKDINFKPPDWVKIQPIYSESNRKDLHYLVCNNEATLVYMANLGCIELNPWHSRISAVEKPDYLLIDLDAKTSGFGEVVTVAKEVKKVLDKAQVPSYPKTSGKTGLHICLPLAAKYDYEQAKQFAQIVVTLVHERLPKVTSLERNPEKRKKQIYLDFLQNRKGQTMAAAYCVRPVPGAAVSTPLDWSEVTARLDPKKFTIRTIGKRLEKKGDLWKPVTGRGINLEKALDRLG